jgi:hypothetical protein
MRTTKIRVRVSKRDPVVETSTNAPTYHIGVTQAAGRIVVPNADVLARHVCEVVIVTVSRPFRPIC